MGDNWRKHKLLFQMLGLGTVASAIGIAIALVVPWFPVDAATQAPRVDTLYNVLLIVSVPIFVFVTLVIVFCVWKFRMRPGEELRDGVPIHGNTKLEIAWTTGPAILLIGLAVYAYVVLRIDEKPQRGELRVQVTGQQFAWSYRYPGLNGKAVKSTVLVLPNGRPVVLKVHTKDVIHDFFVPAFRVKTDTVPGITTTVRATPSRLGSYDVVCAELCGLGHSTMRSTVRVVTPKQFTSWASQQAKATK